MKGFKRAIARSKPVGVAAIDPCDGLADEVRIAPDLEVDALVDAANDPVAIDQTGGRMRRAGLDRFGVFTKDSGLFDRLAPGIDRKANAFSKAW